ncbi:alpha/beta fold hydrolase [Bradyrhizobium sp. CB1650]|uniref:alpha/beta hydrolase n=1 Tax=Bradyrhizobium sp. CB1650 TaxID=3039153 RepID=UPI002435A330|nr:alpha/beta fold hydrolase [Bradyrhizobium sp. CB1650]WGD53169.1 alpha/beta fold hydrolase [Bradyrhizobium sp. CB1650]
MRRTAEFKTEDGTALRGQFHWNSASVAPSIVMCHGFGGVQEHIEHYAALFCEAGFSVLLYDHRGFGASDGTPRQEVNPYIQLSDLRDAISHCLAQPEVQRERGVALWGSSFAGGLAIVTAANDQRVRCLSVQIPNVSGHRNGPKMFTSEEMTEIRRRLREDREARLAGEPPQMIPVFARQPGELAAFLQGVPKRILEPGPTPTRWLNEVTLRSIEYMFEFEPAGWAPYLGAKPIQMILAENDVCTFTNIQRDVYDSIEAPKRLITFPGGHFHAYDRFFKETSEPALEWFLQHHPIA